MRSVRISIPGQSSEALRLSYIGRANIFVAFFFFFFVSPSGIVLFQFLLSYPLQSVNNIVCMLFLSYSTADLVLFVAVCSTPFPFRYHFLRREWFVIASNLQYAFWTRGSSFTEVNIWGKGTETCEKEGEEVRNRKCLLGAPPPVYAACGKWCGRENATQKPMIRGCRRSVGRRKLSPPSLNDAHSCCCPARC